MKKVLVLAAVVCVFATVGSASQLNVWLSASPTEIGTSYAVDVWAQIVVDPAHSGESLTNTGLCDFAFTIYTPGTVGVTVPDEFYPWVDWGTSLSTWANKIDPALGDYEASYTPPTPDGDIDAVEASAGDTRYTRTTPNPTPPGLNTGVGAPILLGTEWWVMNSWEQATLMVSLNPSSRHWTTTPVYGDPLHPTVQTGWGKAAFTALVNNGVTVGPPPGTAPTISIAGPVGMVNTGAHGGLSQNFLMTVALTNEPDPDVTGGTLDYGDGATRPLVLPLPDGPTNHTYTLPGVETSHVFTYSATATNGIAPDGTASGSFTLVESPAIHMYAEGIQYYDDNTVLMYPFDFMNISLAQSEGYIQNWSIVNAVTGLNLSGVGTPGSQVIPVTQLFGTVTFTVSNTGTGFNTDSIDVNFIPEPATLALLGFGAVAALIRRKK